MMTIYAEKNKSQQKGLNELNRTLVHMRSELSSELKQVMSINWETHTGRKCGNKGARHNNNLLY